MNIARPNNERSSLALANEIAADDQYYRSIIEIILFM
jgi:hypothetical protein